MTDRDLSVFLVERNSSLRGVVECIDRGACGIALVVDDGCRLAATITDGDVRRAILAGMSLDESIDRLLKTKQDSLYPKPITALAGTSTEALLELMQQKRIHQVPILDEVGCVVDLVTLDDLVPGERFPLDAVIMAGGYGTRLLPLTKDLPKPLLPVGDRPLMEHIINQLKRAGVSRINVTTHYMSDKIVQQFGDGSELGVDITYVDEKTPLGTAGALGLIEEQQSPLLVLNGDILTSVDFRAMFSFHRKHGAALTVGVRQYDIKVPYGVIERDGPFVQGLKEKPQLSFFVNAGIYIIEPMIHSYLPKHQKFDMTDLIHSLVEDHQVVVNFPIVEYWLDIGQHEEYEKAKQDINSGRFDR